MSASLDKIVEVRSQLAEDLQGYYETFISALDRTPWFRNGTPIRASQIAVPARVLKEEIRVRTIPVAGDRLESGKEIPDWYGYVDPNLTALYEEPTLSKRREESIWKNEQRNLNRAIVIGPPGGGKSFLTDMTAVEIARKSLDRLLQHRGSADELTLPIHLELSELAQPGLPADIEDVLVSLLKRKYGLTALLERWIREKITTEQAWIFLDAFDQVTEQDRATLEKRLRAVETRGWKSRILLTGRTANYERGHIPWLKLVEYELAPFRPQEIDLLVKQWFGDNTHLVTKLHRVLERNHTLRHACRSPLISSLVCLVHEESLVTEATRRVELYSHVLRGLVRGAWKETPLSKQDPYIDDAIRFLEKVAARLFESRPESNLFTNKEIIDAITTTPEPPIPRVLRLQSALNAASLAYAPTLLRDEMLECGVLIGAGLNRRGATQFSFLHRTFLEYLMACDLAARPKKEWLKVVEQRCWDDAGWDEAIVMLCGILPQQDAERVISLLLSVQNDVFGELTILAGKCLAEIGSTGVTDETSSSVMNRLHELLRYYRSEKTDRNRALQVLELFGSEAARVLDFLKSFYIEPALFAIIRNEESWEQLVDRVLNDHRSYRRDKARLALAKADPDRAVPVLIEHINKIDRDEHEFWEMVKTVGVLIGICDHRVFDYISAILSGQLKFRITDFHLHDDDDYFDQLAIAREILDYYSEHLGVIEDGSYHERLKLLATERAWDSLRKHVGVQLFLGGEAFTSLMKSATTEEEHQRIFEFLDSDPLGIKTMEHWHYISGIGDWLNRAAACPEIRRK
jgi:hypothetical protein